MLIWAIAATAAAIIFLWIWALYRRQVKITCRQLAFLKENQTNLRLTSQQPLPELNALIDGINEVIDRSRIIERDAAANESQLKAMITSLSHDIRTPLTSLDGYFQLLLASTSQEEREKYIRIIQTRIKSLKDMLEELFTYTKLQDQDYHLELEDTDFSKCVFDTAFSFFEEFQEKRIQPQVDFYEGHIYISGNEEALRRTIQNLIKNALVHGHTQISLSMFTDHDFAVFSCSNDTLHPEEIQVDQIFQRFYKADTARTQNSTGLGLSIAAGLVRRMGGEIKAHLNGNIFFIQLRFPVKWTARDNKSKESLEDL